MRLYYFFLSVYYFFKHIFIKKHYDVVFYAPSHFNRGDNHENLYFKDLIALCKNHNISYIYFEEPDIYNNQMRSNDALPFDFIYYLVIILRKFMGSEMSHIQTDMKIGNFISKILFYNFSFSNYITLSQSMLSFFNGLNPKAKKFDLQHGTIHARKKSYLYDGIPSVNLLKNKTCLLLSGKGFKDVLVKNDKTKYFINNSNIIGSSLNFLKSNTNKKEKLNKNILVSLQFTHDHTENENMEIYNKLLNLIKIKSSFHFYLRHHPRYNNDFNLKKLLLLSNTSIINGNIYDNLSMCSFHLTTYSTIAFQASMYSIPTFFLKIKSPIMEIFDTQYEYPFFNYSLEDLYDNYDLCSIKVKEWAEDFYTSFSAKKFISILNYEK